MLRDVKQLVYGHSDSRWQSQDSSRVCLTPKSKPSITSRVCVSYTKLLRVHMHLTSRQSRKNAYLLQQGLAEYSPQAKSHLYL